VRTKINKHAFSGGQATVEEHRKLGGNPDIDVAYQWLYMFFEPDDSKLEKIREEYRSGRLLTGELKQILIEKVIGFLHEHRLRREAARAKVRQFKYDGALAQKIWKTDFEKL
jgi:tryptophanyl-tRNA synthetase